MEEKKKFEYSIEKNILESASLSSDAFNGMVTDIFNRLGKRAEEIVPQNVKQLNTVYIVKAMSEGLAKIEHCKGYDKLLDTFSPDHMSSALFVLTVGVHLLGKVDEVE